MRIGLYSKAGRKDVVAARKEIARYGFSSTAEGMRDFRRKTAEILPEKMLKALELRRDYYTLAMCRDLLFHVQEHRYDISRIRRELEVLNLSFMRFDAAADMRSLEEGARLEAENPDTFKNMYKFWCRAC